MTPRYYADLRGLDADEVLEAITRLIATAQCDEWDGVELAMIDEGADGDVIELERERVNAEQKERRDAALVKVRAILVILNFGGLDRLCPSGR